MIKRVCAFCASSNRIAAHFTKAARKLGGILAENQITVVCGGGSVGLMGALTDGALAAGGQVVGVIPKFMVDLEWAHQKVSEQQVVETMAERKAKMIEGTDAVIALPGGTGTIEELFEVISLKRLGIYLKPIVIVNTAGFFDPIIDYLDRCITEHFMDPRHRNIWQFVNEPEAVLPAIENAPFWNSHSRHFAALK